jgi:uncharacterized phiE125 gp8 family phage protein
MQESKHTYIRKNKVGAVEEVINMADIARHLRIDEQDVDEYVKSLVTAAVENIQALTWRTLVAHKYELYFDNFIDTLLPYPPIDASSVKVWYVDKDGIEQELDAQALEVTPDDNEPFLRYDMAMVSGIWLDDSFASVGKRVKIEFTAGYKKLPEGLKSAVQLLTAHLYDTPEATSAFSIIELPMGVRYLISPYRLNKF